MKIASILLTFMLVVTPVYATINFDNSDDALNCGTGIDNISPMSISVWLYLNSGGTNGASRIINKDGSEGWLYWIQAGSNNRVILEYLYTTSEVWRWSATGVITYGAWYNLIMTWDGTQNPTGMKYFKDGTETSYGTTSTGSGTHSDTGGAVFVGNLSASGNRAIDGKMSELAVWAAELTTQEIQFLSKSRVKGLPLQVRPSTLKAYWPLDDEEDGSSGDGDTFKDLSGNGNHCTGDDGSGNSGLTALGETILSYP